MTKLSEKFYRGCQIQDNINEKCDFSKNSAQYLGHVIDGMEFIQVQT